jgi:hypothetical protein
MCFHAEQLQYVRVCMSALLPHNSLSLVSFLQVLLCACLVGLVLLAPLADIDLLLMLIQPSHQAVSHFGTSGCRVTGPTLPVTDCAPLGVSGPAPVRHASCPAGGWSLCCERQKCYASGLAVGSGACLGGGGGAGADYGRARKRRAKAAACCCKSCCAAGSCCSPG